MMETPAASIIILTYNNLDYTRQCIESIFCKTDGPDYEIILVDNASQDDTPRYLRGLAEKHPNIKLILNAENEGFARGNNIGVAAASGSYLVFLNNDTLVTKGWLSKLLEHGRDSQVGMVGPVTNSAANESRISVDYQLKPGQDISGMEEFATRYTAEHAGETFEIDMLAFLCVLIRREVYQEVGPLDESFGQGMFEDDDYALRLRQKGYKLLCAEDVFIHHWGSASFSRLDGFEYWQLFEANRRKFEQKWGLEWQPHLMRTGLLRQQLGEMIDRAAYQAHKLHEREVEIAEVYNSSSWKLVQKIGAVRYALAPRQSWREKILQTISVVFLKKSN